MDSPKRPKGFPIDWNQVYYFCQIAQRGSVKSAASVLGVGASALTEALVELEKTLEVELFHRQHGKLALTPAGSRLFHQAKPIFDSGRRMMDVISPIPLGGYPLEIGIVPGPSMFLAYRLLGRYHTEFGPLGMKVCQSRHEDLEKGLAEARYDFGFADRGSARSDLVAHQVASSIIRFFVAPKWEGKSLAELMTILPLLQFEGDSATQSYAEQVLTELDLTPKSNITSEYPSLLQELCEQGQGIAAFNEASVAAVGAKLVPVELPPGAWEIQDKLFALWTKEAEGAEAVQRLKAMLEAPATRG